MQLETLTLDMGMEKDMYENAGYKLSESASCDLARSICFRQNLTTLTMNKCNFHDAFYVSEASSSLLSKAVK